MEQTDLSTFGIAQPTHAGRLFRASRTLAWAMWTLTIGQVTAGLALAVLNHLTPSRLFAEYVVSQSAAAVAFASVGLVITVRRPDHTVGWLLSVTGIVNGIGSWVGQYARYSLVMRPGVVPMGELAAALNAWAFGPIVALTAIFLPLLFPDGRLPSARWRPVAWFAGAAMLLFTGDQILTPGPIDASLPEVSNPFAPAGAATLLGVISPLAIIGMLLSLASAVTAAVVRFRRTHGVERQQLKWFAYATTLLMLALVTPPFLDPRGFADPVNGSTFLSGVLLAGALPLLAIAVGIAILRYRLYDIDLIMSRTLVYGALTTCIIGVYVVVVGYLGAMFRTDANLAISLVATGLVAVLFQPLRAWLQRRVNRLLYGERDEPYAVIARLGRQLETTLALDAVLPIMVQTVKDALKLPYTAISLSDTGERRIVAEAGTPFRGAPHVHATQPLPSDILTFPLVYQHASVGELLVAPRAPGERLSPADRRLLMLVAQQAGVAAHAARLTRDLQQLTADLQHSREQIVLSREEERRRLRRDLHDGVGPTLASLVQRLDVARGLVERDPDAVEALIGDIKGQVKETIADIRRLVYALRPPVLDEFGLISAIREHIAQVNQAGRLHVTFHAPEQLPPLPAAVEVAAYRISLEAVTNVLRHARACSCRVSLLLAEQNGRRSLSLEIVDDGVGLPRAYRAGVGLMSMRERVAELGGTWTIERQVPAGTRLVALLPVSVG